ncbi:MAG: 50S ribosomal protein L3 [Planctomycetes bacterium]|nr:50S ribosomal protein L3 [Planctomycetota bacterium]
MALGLLGRKIGMTQIFNEAGKVVPVTVIEAGPCHVLQLRTKERDGYEAIQVGFDDKPRRTAIRSERGHVAKLESKRAKRAAAAGVAVAERAGCEPQRFVREFRVAAGDVKVGQKLDVSLLAEVKSVDVTGISKGRGTAGLMKRHNFAGQRATHGVKKVHRHSGGTSANTYPGHVFKGKKMVGRMGAERCTSRNLKVVRVDPENNLLLVNGAVPGPNGGYVVIRTTNMLK